MGNNFQRLITIVVFSALILGCSSKILTKESGFNKVDINELLQEAGKAYQEHDYITAAHRYERALLFNQDNAIIAYNLACCYALQGDSEQASNYVKHAFVNGFRNLRFLQEDPDFDPVREDLIFLETISEIEEKFNIIGTQAYVEAPSLLPYRIRYPENYDASKSYPLLIGMHGYSGNADGFIALYNRMENPRIIYVAPEGQYPLSNNVGPTRHSRSWAINSDDKAYQLKADSQVAEYILNTVRKVSSEHKISDVYLFGFSQGAAFAYTIGIQNHEKIKGVIGFGGYLMETDTRYSVLSNSDIAKGKDLRVFIAHGIDDQAINVEVSRKLVAMLAINGYDASLHEFSGGHQIPAEALNLAVDWMSNKNESED